MRLHQGLPETPGTVKAHEEKTVSCGQEDDGLSDPGGDLMFQIDLPEGPPLGSQARLQPCYRDRRNNYSFNERLYFSFSGPHPGAWWLTGTQS